MIRIAGFVTALGLLAAGPALADVETFSTGVPVNALPGTLDISNDFNLPRDNFEISAFTDVSADFVTIHQQGLGPPPGFSLPKFDIPDGYGLQVTYDYTILDSIAPTSISLVAFGQVASGQDQFHGPQDITVQQGNLFCDSRLHLCSTNEEVRLVEGYWGPITVGFTLTPGAVADLDATGSFTYLVTASHGVDGVKLTLTSAPEPQSWSLMVAGFGGLGAMLRRARRRPVAVPVA